MLVRMRSNSSSHFSSRRVRSRASWKRPPAEAEAAPENPVKVVFLDQDSPPVPGNALPPAKVSFGLPAWSSQVLSRPTPGPFLCRERRCTRSSTTVQARSSINSPYRLPTFRQSWCSATYCRADRPNSARAGRIAGELEQGLPQSFDAVAVPAHLVHDVIGIAPKRVHVKHNTRNAIA